MTHARRPTPNTQRTADPFTQTPRAPREPGLPDQPSAFRLAQTFLRAIQNELLYFVYTWPHGHTSLDYTKPSEFSAALCPFTHASLILSRLPEEAMPLNLSGHIVQQKRSGMKSRSE